MTVSLNTSTPMTHACGPGCSHCTRPTQRRHTGDYFGFKGREQARNNLLLTGNIASMADIQNLSSSRVTPDGEVVNATDAATSLHPGTEPQNTFNPLTLVKKLVTGLLAAGMTIGLVATVVTAIVLRQLYKGGQYLAGKAKAGIDFAKNNTAKTVAKASGNGLVQFGKKYGPKALKFIWKVVTHPAMIFVPGLGGAKAGAFLAGRFPRIAGVVARLARYKWVARVLEKIPGVGPKIKPFTQVIK